MGWPTEDKIPNKFLLHWAVVEEPDVKLGDEGSIYLWLKPLSETEEEHDDWQDYLLSFYDGKSQPRAHKLSYSRELHEKTQEAIEMLMGGQGVGGTNEGEPGEGEGSEKGAEEKTGEGKGKGSLTRNGEIMFHKLPPPVLPDKEGY